MSMSWSSVFLWFLPFKPHKRGSVIQSITLVQMWNISSTIPWIAMEFCMGICGPQRMNPNNHGDLLTFPDVPPWGRCMWFSMKCLDYWLTIGNRETGLQCGHKPSCSMQINVAISCSDEQQCVLNCIYFSSPVLLSAIRDAHVPFMIAGRTAAEIYCHRRVTVPQLNNSISRDPTATKQYTSNNKDAFKYRDHGGSFLPVSFIQLSLARAWITVSALSCPHVWCGGGVSPTCPPLRWPQTTGCYWGTSRGKLQRVRKTDVIGAQIIGNAKCICHHACAACVPR